VNTTLASFLDDAAVFWLSPGNEWRELPRGEVPVFSIKTEDVGFTGAYSHTPTSPNVVPER
jgi:hypothetical protein